MKLVNIKIFPNGTSGWESDLLVFGENITQLFGSNGCGKTPIVQSIAFCLGYPSIFRKDIYDKCHFAVLEVNTPKGNLILKRIYSKNSLDVEVTEPNGVRQRFLDEKEYSLYLFEWIGLKVNNLVNNANKITSPYLSTMLPLFYLDQDDGYSKFYSPPTNFIKDQFSEMMRMIFNLPTKNSFDLKKEKILAKQRLDFLDKQVDICARNVSISEAEVGAIKEDPEEIKREITVLEGSIEELKGSGASHDDSINVLDHLISKHRSMIRDLSLEAMQVNKRRRSIEQIVKEINTEIETLNLNEEARRVFLSFEEICGSSQCQLFSSSSEAYSKNLLYLKDQIKDLERNAEIDEIKLVGIEEQKKQTEDLVASIIDDRNASLDKSEISALVDAISAIKNQIFGLQNKLNEFQKLETLESKHLEVFRKRNDAIDKYQSFSSERSLSPKVARVRADLREYLLFWLEKINTNNISRDITFKDDFTPYLGSETIAQLKGSTRTRAVLAFHAALLELILKNECNAFNFLILDTPKQHEIHNDDLDCYITGLKELCAEFNLQVVFSTTEYHYSGDGKDEEWTPKYAGEKQLMFLKASELIPIQQR